MCKMPANVIKRPPLNIIINTNIIIIIIIIIISIIIINIS